MKAKKTPIVVVGIVAVIAVIAVIAFMLGRGTSVDDHVASSPAVPSETTTNAPEETSGEQENYPGAMIGNTQRTWPDRRLGIYDDSAHATPGTYSVDWAWQRPVWTPINHDGDFPETVKSGGWEQCQKADEIRLEGKTQQQYVNARYLVVNEQAGPTRLERGVPRGYAHSPQGAIVSSMNLLGYGAFGQGDEIGEEIDKRLWHTSARYKEEQARRKIEITKEYMQWKRADLIPGSSFFKVRECTDNVVVVEIALKYPNDPRVDWQYVVGRVPMVWRDGDWQPDLNGNNDKYLGMKQNELDSFTEVTYS